MRQIRIIVEKHPDGYVAYPLGVQGVVVGEGDTCEAAVADVKSAIKFTSRALGRMFSKSNLQCLKLLLLKPPSRSNGQVSFR